MTDLLKTEHFELALGSSCIMLKSIIHSLFSYTSHFLDKTPIPLAGNICFALVNTIFPYCFYIQTFITNIMFYIKYNMFCSTLFVLHNMQLINIQWGTEHIS